MLKQYIKFFVNGGVLGIISWLLQGILFQLIGGQSGIDYGIATALTYIPLVLINFLIQRKWIFNRDGLFLRFVTANLGIMLLVTLLSPFFRMLITMMAGVEWGDRGGFVVAALIGSIPSFLLKRIWVFQYSATSQKTFVTSD